MRAALLALEVLLLVLDLDLLIARVAPAIPVSLLVVHSLTHRLPDPVPPTTPVSLLVVHSHSLLVVTSVAPVVLLV